MRRETAANSIKLTPLPSKVLFFSLEPSHRYFSHRVRAPIEIKNLVARKINDGCRGGFSYVIPQRYNLAEWREVVCIFSSSSSSPPLRSRGGLRSEMPA